MEQAVLKVRRSAFRRLGQYVFVKHVRLGRDVVAEPGQPVPATVRLFHLQALYRRGFIGHVGEPWTDDALKRAALREERDAARAADERDAHVDALQAQAEAELEKAAQAEARAAELEAEALGAADGDDDGEAS